jgi:hypothetical protein
MKIYRIAQVVEEIYPEDVEGVLQSFNTKRFSNWLQKG